MKAVTEFDQGQMFCGSGPPLLLSFNGGYTLHCRGGGGGGGGFLTFAPFQGLTKAWHCPMRISKIWYHLPPPPPPLHVFLHSPLYVSIISIWQNLGRKLMKSGSPHRRTEKYGSPPPPPQKKNLYPILSSNDF